jgi:hypothetical protein
VFSILLFLEKFAPVFFKNFYQKADIVKMISIFIFLNLIVLFYSLYYVEKIKSPSFLGFSRNDPNRFIAVEDDSNWYRFNANKEFFELLKNNQGIMLFGASSAELVKIKTDDETENYNSLFPHRLPPHNAVFHFMGASHLCNECKYL